jgi:hypothetical protein
VPNRLSYFYQRVHYRYAEENGDIGGSKAALLAEITVVENLVLNDIADITSFNIDLAERTATLTAHGVKAPDMDKFRSDYLIRLSKSKSSKVVAAGRCLKNEMRKVIGEANNRRGQDSDAAVESILGANLRDFFVFVERFVASNDPEPSSSDVKIASGNEQSRRVLDHAAGKSKSKSPAATASSR